ncbi:MAG TPA: hypothetical protein VJV75_11110 [Candidatus Polarisedimenticolia bacterium]|nr:hypothetical protein [Candidatus Polarisedimenticolia bacterium]
MRDPSAPRQPLFRVARSLTGLLLLAGGAAWAAPGDARSATASRTASESLDALVARHVEARGGRKAIEALDNLELDLSIVEPTFAVKGLYRADRKGRMRIDILVEGRRVFSEAYDGHEGRKLDEGATQPDPEPSAQGTRALRNSARLPTKILGLHEMRSNGHRLESAGRETVASVSYHVVVLTLDTGETFRYYLDPDTFLIARERVTKALHPDVDPTPTTIETVYGDFRKIGGVVFAFHAEETDMATGKLLQTSTILAGRPNRPAEDAVFRLEK